MLVCFLCVFTVFFCYFDFVPVLGCFLMFVLYAFLHGFSVIVDFTCGFTCFRIVDFRRVFAYFFDV